MAKEKEMNVAGLNPDNFLQGGLKTDFRGKIVSADYVRWDYDGNIEEPVLGAKLGIQPEDEDEEVYEQVWSAGDLKNFVPSEDGRTPTDDDEGGQYPLRVGKRAEMNNNTNFSHLMESILDAGADKKRFTRANLTPSIRCLIGLDAHWDRVEQKKRSGMQDNDEGGKARKRDVLVVTEVFGYDPDAADEKPAKKATSSKVKSKAAEEEEEESAKEEEPEEQTLDQIVEGHVTAAIEEAGGKLKKSKLASAILEAMAKDPQKSKAVKLVNNDEWVEDDDRPWTYNERTGTLSA